MSNFAHVERVTAEVGGRQITFRSKLEYRWCVWCEFRKQQGLIKEWWYEDQDSLFELQMNYRYNKAMYLPDFTILTNEDDYEIEETKGWFSSKDYTKLRLIAEQYDNEITLIFASKPNKTQYARAERLEPHIKRIIWNANRDIFTKIKHLFEV